MTGGNNMIVAQLAELVADLERDGIETAAGLGELSRMAFGTWRALSTRG